MKRALATALILLLTSAASAHDMPSGCYAVTEHEVVRAWGGFSIVGLNRFIRDDRTVPSTDGRMWVCTAGRADPVLFLPKIER